MKTISSDDYCCCYCCFPPSDVAIVAVAALVGDVVFAVVVDASLFAPSL